MEVPRVSGIYSIFWGEFVEVNRVIFWYLGFVLRDAKVKK